MFTLNRSFYTYVPVDRRHPQRTQRPVPALSLHTRYTYKLYIWSHHHVRHREIRTTLYLVWRFSPSYVVVTQIRGHIAGSSSPLPPTVRVLHFYREKISALSSLVDSRRIVLTHARRSQRLLLFILFLQINSKSRHGGIRTHGPALVAFEGYH